MRILHIVFFLLMLIFMAVQYNDPDGLMWAVIYAVPALLMLRIVLWPNCFTTPSGKALRCFSIAVMAAGTILLWPKSSEFWQQGVWWEAEQVREGLGMMVALLVTLSSFLMKSKK